MTRDSRLPPVSRSSFLFGPVASRRLGRSLGIDVVPAKTCSFDCVYCESGRTTKQQIQRVPFVLVEKVLEELDAFLDRDSGPIDAVTFSSAGEPTLCMGLGKIIERMKLRVDSPVVVITNGSLLWDPQVRAELRKADRVMPSLDAALPRTFRRVNRPHLELDLDMVLDGLEAFRSEFEGEFWLEILLVAGMNDTEEDVEALRLALRRIRPDVVQLNTVVRPPAQEGVRGISRQRMQEIEAALDYAHIEIIGEYRGAFVSGSRDELPERIFHLVARRPCTPRQIAQSLGMTLGELHRVLDSLLERGELRIARYADRQFVCLPGRDSVL